MRAWVIGFVQGSTLTIAALGIAILVMGVDNRLPACVKGAPEDVVVYRSQVPGPWDSCLPADDLVGDQAWADRR